MEQINQNVQRIQSWARLVAAVTPQTLFRIGMLTMLLTCAAIMRLVEAGQLNLDTRSNAICLTLN